jgi:hypothetical protein
MSRFRLPTACLMAIISNGAFSAGLPEAIQANGEVIVLSVHAVGAQIYECKADGSGKLTWQFREPIATLMSDGRTIGRHYAGPTWEVGGSRITGKVVGHAPGATASDIPWLKLSATELGGDGPLKNVTTIQRIDTNGGLLDASCGKVGDFAAQPYTANYEFLQK